VFSRERLGAREGRSEHLIDRPPPQTQTQLARLDAGQLDETFDEAVETVALLVDHLQHLAPRLRAERDRLPVVSLPAQLVEERRDRRLDGRERRAYVVRDGVEQGRLQLLALAERLGVARALEGPAQLLVEPLDLQTPGLRLLGAPARARGELAGDDGREKEDGQRDPVLQLGDVQGAERGEEEEVEAEHRQHRGHERRPALHPGGDEEHGEEQRQRDGRRVDMPAEQLQRGRQRSDARRGDQIARPAPL
jgi:hypothetical protein